MWRGKTYSPLHSIDEEGPRAADAETAEEDSHTFSFIGLSRDAESARPDSYHAFAAATVVVLRG